MSAPGTERCAAEGVASEAHQESDAAAAPHGEIDERPEQQRFGDGAERRQHDAGGERGPAPAPVADQEAPELGGGARPRLLDGGAQLDRQSRLLGGVERCGRRRAQQDGAADGDLRGAVLGGGRRRGGGIDGGHRWTRSQRSNQAAGLGAACDRARGHQRRDGPCRAVQPGDSRPARSLKRVRDQRVAVGRSQRAQPASEWANERVAGGELAEGVGGNRHPVQVDVTQERLAPDPPPPPRGVHDLHEAAVHPPDDDEVNQPRRQPRHHDGGERISLGEEQVVDRHRHLLGVEAQAGTQRLQRVD